MGELPLRLAVVGDELVAGAGDPKGLGWLGRVAGPHPDARPADRHGARGARRDEHGPRRPLGRRGHAPLLPRGRQPAGRRARPGRRRRRACRSPAAGSTSRTSSTSPSSAGSRRSSSAPRPAAPPTPRSSADLSAAFADVATRRRVPFVDTFTPLAAHEQWLGDLAAGDGILPGQAGYGLMAWLVLHTGWHAWLGPAGRRAPDQPAGSQRVSAACPAPPSGPCRARSAACRP